MAGAASTVEAVSAIHYSISCWVEYWMNKGERREKTFSSMKIKNKIKIKMEKGVGESERWKVATAAS